MSQFRPVNFNQASVRANELVANTKLGIGTHSQTSELHIKATAPELQIEGASATMKVVASGSETTFRSDQDVKWTSADAGTVHMTLDGQGGALELTQVSNTFQITSSSNVVTEYTRSKKFIKYPRVAMTAATTSGYTASATNVLNDDYTNYAPWKAFDTTIDGNGGWATDYLYDSSTGEATTSATSFNNRYGEYIDLQLPDAIKVSHFIIKTRESGTYIPEDSPGEGYLYGSNDGSNWTQLKFFSGLTYGGMATNGNTYEEVQVNATGFYNYLRLQVTKRAGQNSSDGFIAIGELEYYGIPEYDPEAHGTDVIMRSVPNVPNTDWLEVYYDAGETSSYSGSGTTVSDIKPNGTAVNGTLTNGVGFDSTWKAFTFDGVNDHISGTLGNAGDFDFTVSVWVKRSSTSTIDEVFFIGSVSNGQGAGLQFKSTSDGSLFFYSYAGPEVDYTIGAIEAGESWVHLTAVRQGSDRKLYFNGEYIPLGIIDNGTALSIPANASFRLGSRTNGGNPLHGSIANFRLFNRALTADEAWQLYAYQKEYFQVSPDVLTFKGGRLGIGTSEPRGTLHVEGSGIYFPQNRTLPTGCRHVSGMLNYYEQGTWTPIIGGSTSGEKTPGTANVGWYVRIGNLVTIGATVHWDGGDATLSGNIIIKGLPYSSDPSTNSRTAMVTGAVPTGSITTSTGMTTLKVVLDPGLSYLWLIAQDDADDNNYTHTPTIDTDGHIYGLGGTYLTAQ